MCHHIQKIIFALQRKMTECEIILKIKPGWDVAPLDCFREHWPDMDLMVDANNANDFHRDQEFLFNVDRYSLMMFEQPLAAKDIYYHARLQEQIRMPVWRRSSRLAVSLISSRGAWVD